MENITNTKALAINDIESLTFNEANDHMKLLRVPYNTLESG